MARSSSIRVIGWRAVRTFGRRELALKSEARPIARIQLFKTLGPGAGEIVNLPTLSVRGVLDQVDKDTLSVAGVVGEYERLVLIDANSDRVVGV